MRSHAFNGSCKGKSQELVPFSCCYDIYYEGRLGFFSACSLLISGNDVSPAGEPLLRRGQANDSVAWRFSSPTFLPQLSGRMV